MTEEELAKDYAFMHYGDTDNDGNPLTDDIIMQRSFLAGYEQAKKDLSCVQQRLNMLEEHNMTIDDVIASLEKHNEIHSRQEPRAYYITKALNIAIDFLKNHRWHYPSKGELPRFGIKVLIKAHSRDEVDVGSIFYPDAFTLSLKRWEIYTDNVDRFYSDKEILAWQYLPELPKEEE